MTEKPIIFSAPMIRAILEGRKTQTRRVMTPSNTLFNGRPWPKEAKLQTFDWKAAFVDNGPSPAGNPGPYLHLPCTSSDENWKDTRHRIYPRHQPGDVLWGKEAFRGDKGYDGYPPRGWSHWPVHYEADGAPDLREGMGADGKLRSSIHMPRWASRIEIRITSVEIERLQDISEEDAQAEGLWGPMIDPKLDGMINQVGVSPRHAFKSLWILIYGPRSWEENPWVLALTFEKLDS